MNVIRTVMNVIPEKQKEVLQTLILMAELTENEKGCLNFGIYGDIENENVFNLISEWETRKELNRHMQSDKFTVLMGIKSLLAEPLKIQIFTVSDTEGMEAVNAVMSRYGERDMLEVKPMTALPEPVRAVVSKTASTERTRSINPKTTGGLAKAKGAHAGATRHVVVRKKPATPPPDVSSLSSVSEPD